MGERGAGRLTTHNSIAYAPGLIKAFGTITGLAETEGGVERLGETLTPVFNPADHPDFAFLRKEVLLGLTWFQGAGAANISVGVISNQTTDSIGVIELTAADTPFNFGIVDNSALGGLTDIGVGTCRDSRWKRGTGMAAGQFRILRGLTAAGFASQIATFSVAPSSLVPVDMVLAPGAAFVIQTIAVNVGINFSALWRERRAFPGELPR